MNGTRGESVTDRYYAVLEQITLAARRSERPASSVSLVVVTKTHPVETIMEVYQAGARTFGENYVEDAAPKIAQLKTCSDISWHMIGHIQSRKTAPVVELFDVVHSLDRLKVARRLNETAGELGKRLPVLLECNLSGEESKSGYPLWLPEQQAAFLSEVESLLSLSHLDLRGLMTMPPFFEDPQMSRPYFRRLRLLRDRLQRTFPQLSLDELSMGMSDDFPVAIEEGATMIRVGTAIMGARLP